MDASPASGFKSSDNAAGGKVVYWMLEPLRAWSVDKWTGTLQHSTDFSTLGQTVDAFTHYVFHESRAQMVFADMQSERLPISEETTDLPS